MIQLSHENLMESIKQIESILRKIASINQDNLTKSQKTLLERRVLALNISLELLNKELLKFQSK